MQADVTDLSVLVNDSFGLVYTSGHVSVWVADEYHWTVADHVQAAIDGGGRIVEVVEYGEQIEDELWLEKMPAHLLIVGRQEGSA